MITSALREFNFQNHLTEMFPTVPSVAIFQQAADELRAMGSDGFRPNKKYGSTAALVVLNRAVYAAGIENRSAYYRGPFVVPQHFHEVFRNTILAVIAEIFPQKADAFMCDGFLLGEICMSDLANCCRDLASGACKFCNAVEQRTGFRNMLFAADQRFQACGKTQWQEFSVHADLRPDGYGAFAPMLCSFPVGAPKEEKSKDGRSPWETRDAIERGVPVCPHSQGRWGCRFGRTRTCVFPHVHADGTATASTTGDASGIVALVPGANAGLWQLPHHAAAAAAVPVAAAAAVAPAGPTVEELKLQLDSLQAQLLQLRIAAAKQELEAKHAAAAAAPATPAAAAAPATPAVPAAPADAPAARKQRLARDALRAERRMQRGAGKVGQEAGPSSEPSS